MKAAINPMLERGRRLVPADDAEGLGEMLRRAALLPRKDRLLVELLQRNATRRQIAELLGLPPGTVCRRLYRLGQRLHDPVVIALLDEHCPLEPQVRQVGVERLLLGHSIPQLRRKHQLHTREIERILGQIAGWYQGLLAARKAYAQSRARSPKPDL